MIRLSRSKIQNLAANEAVFQRGLSYFKEKRVIHAACSKNKKIYTFTVQGNQKYRVTVEETPEQDVEFSCNCPAIYSQKGRRLFFFRFKTREPDKHTLVNHWFK